MDTEKKPEPPDSQMRVGAIPHGVEVLLKKASVDPEFRTLLLEQRGDAARVIDLELTDAERQMLAHIPAEQLEQIISQATATCAGVWPYFSAISTTRSAMSNTKSP